VITAEYSERTVITAEYSERTLPTAVYRERTVAEPCSKLRGSYSLGSNLARGHLNADKL